MNKKKLSLNKKSLSKMSKEGMSEVQGGAGAWTGGCTDGCGGGASFSTWWNCTKASCTADCGTQSCKTADFCTI